MELLHGSHATEIFAGMCLTDSETAAVNYAAENDGGHLVVVEIDFDGLTVVNLGEIRTNDSGDFVAPGDDGLTVDNADVLIFTETCPQNTTHTTWRLMTAAAVAATRIVYIEAI